VPDRIVSRLLRGADDSFTSTAEDRGCGRDAAQCRHLASVLQRQDAAYGHVRAMDANDHATVSTVYDEVQPRGAKYAGATDVETPRALNRVHHRRRDRGLQPPGPATCVVHASTVWSDRVNPRVAVQPTDE
jgi:hypothetical protein